MRNEMQGQQVLPVPNPTDWLTRKAVAESLGVHERTVDRWGRSGTLKEHRPFGGRGERTPVLYWGPDVVALGEARGMVKPAAGR